MHVLHGHNAVVHQHAQCKHERKEHHGVQCDAHGVQDHEAEQHTGGYGYAHKERIAEPEEEHQYEHDQKDAENDAVLQLGDLIARLIALVIGDRDLQIGREYRGLCIGQDLFDLVAGDDQVFTRSLFHVQHHHGLLVFACVALFLDLRELDRCNVLQIDHIGILILDNGVLDLLHGAVFPVDAHIPAVAVHQKVAS